MYFSKNTRVLSQSKIAIIGGTGVMGKTLIRLFRPTFSEIFIYSRSIQKAKKASKELGVKYCDLKEAIQSDIIIASVPLDIIVKMSRLITNKMKSSSLYIEISSVKTGIVDQITKQIPKDIEYLSLHPLFGGNIKEFHGKNILFIPVKFGPISKMIINYLKSIGINLTEVEINYHDKLMAIIQVLHHFGLISLCFSLMNRLPKEFNEELSTTLFKQTLDHLDLLNDNLSTISQIQKYNPYSSWARNLFIEDVQKLEDFKKIKRIIESFDKLEKLISKN